MSRSQSITIEKNVCCLPGYENLDTASISRRMPRRFQLKSTEELRMEQQTKRGRHLILKYAG